MEERERKRERRKREEKREEEEEGNKRGPTFPVYTWKTHGLASNIGQNFN